jgi:hypothetical protein
MGSKAGWCTPAGTQPIAAKMPSHRGSPQASRPGSRDAEFPVTVMRCRVCSAIRDHDEWNAAERGETPLQRADRELTRSRNRHAVVPGPYR